MTHGEKGLFLLHLLMTSLNTAMYIWLDLRMKVFRDLLPSKMKLIINSI